MATNIVYFYGQPVVTEKNVRYKLQNSALGVFMILSVITDKIGDFKGFIRYN